MSGILMGVSVNNCLRQNARRFSLYNDGNVIFVYDLGSQDQLKEAEAVKVILQDVESRDKRLKALEKDSLIVCYELMQDDSREIEFAVGEPLTPKEKKQAKWLKPQRSFIRIPSGQLRFESPNSLSIDDDEPYDKGVTVEVPPGDYVLTLERINWEEMEENLEDMDLPTEFISICPAEQAKPHKPKAFLSWGSLVGDRAKWESDWKVKVNTFHGLTQGTWNKQPVINFTPAAARKLNARVGDILHAEGEGLSFDFCYLGVRTVHGVERAFGKEVVDEALKGVAVVSVPQFAETPGATLICFEGTGASELSVPDKQQPVSIVRTGRKAFEPSDNSFAADIKIEKDQVVGRVLSCSKKFLYVNVIPLHLMKMGFKFGSPIQMTIGADSREVYFGNDVTKAVIEAAKAGDPKQIGLNGRVMNHWEIRGLEVLDLAPLAGEDHGIVAKSGDIVVFKR